MAHSIADLLTWYRVIPIVENQAQLMRVAKMSHYRVLLLSHCSIFDLLPWLPDRKSDGPAIYVDIDHVSGVHADAAALHYLAEQIQAAGILSANPRVLETAKTFGLETILHLFAADSTGLENTLETVDLTPIDLFSVSPGLVIPHILPPLTSVLPLHFIGSGLISTDRQVQAILDAGAIGVAVRQNDLTS